VPITEGLTTAPVDNAGTKIAPLYDQNAGLFYFMRRVTAAFLATFRADAAVSVAGPGEWSVQAAPASNTIASGTKVAGGAGVRHVLRSVSASAGAVGAPAATVLTVVVRDGAAGVGPILWQRNVGVEAVAGKVNGFDLAGLNLVGSANTALTVEFTGAGGAGVFESLSATGFDAA
jgi:hypothetical protein